MKKLTLAFALGSALNLIAAQAEATALSTSFGGNPFVDTTLNGTTEAARPELKGTVLVDTLQSFNYGSLGISGTVQNRVVREDVSQTLDFYWRVTVDPSSTGGSVSAFRLANFGYPNITDADWRIDGLGSVPASTGRLFNPATYPTGSINFLFGGNGVSAADPALNSSGSSFFFLHTDARFFDMTAQYDLLAGPGQTLSAEFATYRPSAVPVPAALCLMGPVVVGLLSSSRKRRMS